MPRPRYSGVCATAGCPTDTIAGESHCAAHTKVRNNWHTSRRREGTKSGWQQQREAQAVMARDHGICHVCGRDDADTIDHIIPIAEGGPDHPANKAPIHKYPCHARKTADESRRARLRHLAATTHGDGEG